MFRAAPENERETKGELMTKVYQATDIGPRRELNEDAVAVLENGTYIVADGMGGYAAGEVASHILVDGVKESLATAERVDEFALRDAVLHANRAILTTVRSHPSYSGMGTTATLCHVRESMAFWAHVGDSRLYHLHDGTFRQITHDHSLVSDLVASGTITPAEAREHPKRNVITRAVGVEEYLDVDIGRFCVEDGDALLLASDGLTTVVPDEELCRVLSHPPEGEDLAAKLVARALAEGSRDNISAIVVLYNP